MSSISDLYDNDITLELEMGVHENGDIYLYAENLFPDSDDSSLIISRDGNILREDWIDDAGSVEVQDVSLYDVLIRALTSELDDL